MDQWWWRWVQRAFLPKCNRGHTRVNTIFMWFWKTCHWHYPRSTIKKHKICNRFWKCIYCVLENNSFRCNSGACSAFGALLWQRHRLHKLWRDTLTDKWWSAVNYHFQSVSCVAVGTCVTKWLWLLDSVADTSVSRRHNDTHTTQSVVSESSGMCHTLNNTHTRFLRSFKTTV